MKFDPDIHHRRSIRLKHYDYSQKGAYFITICTRNREIIFDHNSIKNMIKKWWEKLPNKFHNVEIDEFIVMPNHIHGIIFIVGVVVVGADPCVCPNEKLGEHTGSPLHKIVQWFKTMTTNEYINNVKMFGWKSFDGKLWQRNYYEHIIRNEKELDVVRKYIINNPLQWDFDKNNLTPISKPSS